jgi:hypothetical protein
MIQDYVLPFLAIFMLPEIFLRMSFKVLQGSKTWKDFKEHLNPP